MPPQVQAKFRCNTTEGSHENRLVRLNPVTGGSGASEENQSFWNATPNGILEMHITNPSAADFFTEGREYKLTIEEVSAAA